MNKVKLIVIVFFSLLILLFFILGNSMKSDCNYIDLVSDYVVEELGWSEESIYKLEVDKSYKGDANNSDKIRVLVTHVDDMKRDPAIRGGGKSISVYIDSKSCAVIEHLHSQ